jgi:hypothetical protein
MANTYTQIYLHVVFDVSVIVAIRFSKNMSNLEPMMLGTARYTF